MPPTPNNTHLAAGSGQPPGSSRACLVNLPLRCSSLPPELLLYDTPAYAPPEAALGLPITPASDIWSLACVVYEMSTGSKLFPPQRQRQQQQGAASGGGSSGARASGGGAAGPLSLGVGVEEEVDEVEHHLWQMQALLGRFPLKVGLGCRSRFRPKVGLGFTSKRV